MDMNNRPYVSETSNVFNENVYNTVPAQYGNNNVLVTHGQHRKIYDNTSTSIAGQQQSLQQQPFNYNMLNQQNYQQPDQIPGQRHIIPGGVTYTFSPMAENYALRNFTEYGGQLNRNNQMANSYQQPLNLQQQIAMNQLQKNALESMLLHEQFRENPFKLQFHKDGQTDTGDLTYKYPDICNFFELVLLVLTLFVLQRKELRIKPELPVESSKSVEDKGIQYSPAQETVEVQYNSIVACNCHNYKEPTMTDSQTETKKVTFDESKSANGRAIRRRRYNANRRSARTVDEDSSDSSNDASQSSEENNS